MALEGAHTGLKTVCAPDRACWNLWERSGQKFQHYGWHWKGRIRDLKQYVPRTEPVGIYGNGVDRNSNTMDGTGRGAYGT